MTFTRAASSIVCLFSLLGCMSSGNGSSDDDDRTWPDGGTDARPDGGTECSDDSDCSDGDDCNGVERCVDGACVAGEPRDDDTDGFACDVDCDDADPDVYPGAPGDKGVADWRLATVDLEGGYYTALALDRTGAPTIAYIATDAGELRRARLVDGIWRIETIVESAGATYPAYEIDREGTSVLCYEDRGAVFCGSDESGAWSFVVIDDWVNDTQPVLAIDENGTRHLAYFDGKGISHGVDTGSGWEIEFAVANGAVAPSLALAPDGTANITYSIRGPIDLHHAFDTDRYWQIDVVDETEAAGMQSSLAIDEDGTLEVAYVVGPATSNRELRFAHKAEGEGLWSIETVDDSGDDTGWWPSLALDGHGAAHVSYDRLIGDVNELRYATNASGEWAVMTIDSHWTGFFTSIAVDADGAVHISYYDGSEWSLRYATNRIPLDGVDHDCDGEDG